MFPKTRNVIFASAAFAAVASFTAPLDAQRGQGEQNRRTPSRSAPQRSGGGDQRPAPQAQPDRQTRPAPTPPAQGNGPSRGGARTAPPAPNPGARAQAIPRQGPLPSQPNVYRGDNSSRSVYAPRGSYQAPRGYVQPRSVPYSTYNTYNRSYREVRRPVFVQPYYSFRPRFSLGFGISVGYAVSYPFQYYDPYGSYNYRIGVVPGYSTRPYGSDYYSSYYGGRVGGLSFNLDPFDAQVFIDGEYVGVADDFSAGQMPLTLNSGRHHVDLSADGFMPVSFDITVVAGQVIPYQGTMPYLR